MKFVVRYYTALILIFCSVDQDGFCSWNKIKQFNEPIGCGFFFDANHGLIGSGQFDRNSSSFVSTSPLHIFITSDGGTTWVQTISPTGTGRITSIFMMDGSIGYASIYSFQYSIWKTTDGGNTWFDFTQGHQDLTTSIFATKHALIKTIWLGIRGGVSLNNGASFSQTFTSTSNGSNGIDFSDDNTGLVSMGPGGGSWITSNAGVSWNQGDDLPESWSIYGLKGTKTFYALPEDFNSTGQTVFWTQNGGQNWKTRFNFSNFLSFTGHIAGMGNTLYVQTDVLANQGLFRSDDLGLNWVNVGGPSNTRDTRFIVTGCKGEVVYAFDTQGGVWKTTDGGNGTLNGSSTIGSTLAIPQDSLYIETYYCKPINIPIDLLNPGCSEIVIDGITISPNPYNEFTFGSQVNGSIISTISTFTFPITFQTDSNVTRHTMVEIKAHSGTQSIDTTIILVAKHSTAPEPYLTDLKTTKVGDTVLVPVFIKVTNDSFSINHFSFHLSYDGDILTPAFEKYLTSGTLSASGTVSIGKPEYNGILVTVNLPKPITQDSDLAKPLIYVRLGVTLSRNLKCPVLLDSFSVATNTPFALCSIPETEFIVDPQCGEKSISAFMFDGTMPGFLSAHPNPSSGNEVEASIYLPCDNSVTIDLIDGMGKIVRNIYDGVSLQHGEHTFNINTSSVSNGTYLLRMRTSDGYISHRNIIILR